jgi:hypothetical protein
MNALTTITAAAEFVPSPALHAEMVRFAAMRAAWDDMADAALDLDTDRYEQAKACFNIAKEG